MSVLLVSVVSCAGDDQTEKAASILAEANRAARENLRSGTGTGTVEEYSFDASKKKVLTTRARIEVSTLGEKYYIRESFETHSDPKIATRVIIFDGSGLFVNDIDNSPKKSSEAKIYDIKPRNHQVLIRQSGFRFDPARLPEYVDPARSTEHKSHNFSIRRLANGYSGGFDYGETQNRVIFTSSDDAGQNVIEKQINPPAISPCLVYRVGWAQQNGVWYVKSLEEEFNMADGSGFLKRLQYDSFEPNAAVSADKFWFSSLEVAHGARIIDVSAPDGISVIDRNSVNKETEQSKLDSMIEQVKVLPRDPLPLKPGRSWIRLVLWIVSGLLSIAGLGLIWRRWFRGRKAN